MSLAATPSPPYYAVIFSSIRENDNEAYMDMAIKMDELAKEQPGFLGFETARDLLGVSVSYWKDLGSIQQWKMNLDHIEAQNKGKSDWYKSYKVRIAKVEREYSFDKD
jgi:heme-degrading monooxygenase HmoA